MVLGNWGGAVLFGGLSNRRERMRFAQVIKTLMQRFQAEGIDFALSGGLALSTMAVVWFTQDIDLVVNFKSTPFGRRI